MTRSKTIFDRHGVLAEYVDDELVYLREEAPKSGKNIHVMRDIKPYRNMIDGKIITSRSEHRELLRRNNCFEVGNETMETKLLPPKNTRRETLHRMLGDMSDKQANKILRDLRRH